MTIRTRAQLNSDADNFIQDNTTADVTPAEVRQRIKDLADSARLTEDFKGFRAHKNNTHQTGIPSATNTLVTFSTESFDIGGHFASNAWTPPAGLVRIGATVHVSSGVVADKRNWLALAKNGSIAFYGGILHSSYVDSFSPMLDVLDNASGSDAYTLFFLGEGAGDKTIYGDPAFTYFFGHTL